MISLIFIFNLMAADVAIQGPQTTDLEFEKQVMSRPQTQDFVSYSWNQQRGQIRPLLEELKKAQFYFLKGSLEQCKVHFKNIVEQKYNKHWNRRAREIIHYSHLRLAQLSEEKVLRESWMEQAVLFQPQLNPDSDLFPPHFVDEYEKLRSQRPVKIFPLPEGHENFSKIYINGKLKSDRSSFFRSRGGNLRISFLSNRWHSVHIVSKADELKDRKLPLQAMATGNCYNPQFQIAKAASENLVLIDSDCSSQTALPMPNALAQSQPIQPTTSNTTQAFYKNKWFWIGVSVVATGLILYHHDQQQRNRAPTSVPSSPPPPSTPTSVPPAPPQPIEISNQ